MVKLSRMYLLVILFLFAAGNLFAATYFVSTAGSDSNDGLSWSTAFATVQKGINSANAAGSSEVWVAQGTYYPTAFLTDVTGLRSTDAYKSFLMYAGVNVYGGFAGNEATKEARQLLSADPWDYSYPSVLDGSATGSHHVVWFCTNGFHTETMEGISAYFPNSLASQAILDGFTVTGGFANYPARIENLTDPKNNIVHYSGGGVALTGKGEVHNCKIENNKAKYSGAGITMQFDSKVLNTLIQNNEGVGANFYYAGIFGFGAFNYWRVDGAGLAARGDATYRPLIDNSVIHNNLGKANDNYPGTPTTTSNKFNQGGGVYLYYADVKNTKISSNNIVNNPSPYSGGSSASCGGGIYMYSRATLDNCEITDNGFVTSAQNGAGIFIGDYNKLATDYTQLYVKNCYIHTNRAGGAIAYDSKYQQIENTVVANNPGYGVYGYGNAQNGRTVNCLIYNNGGGWVQTSNTGNGNNWLINSTVTKNSGPGVLVQNSNTNYIRNSVVWGNGTSTLPATVQVNNSAFSYTPPVGTGNIQLSLTNSDLGTPKGPLFLNPTATAGIGAAGWADASWRVEETSPCVDVGNNTYILPITTTDINGDLRNQGAAVDMGAYEFTLYQLSLSVTPAEGGVAIIENNSATSGMFAPGALITVRATPSAGYSFWKWTIDGITANKISEFSFNMPAENLALVANFSENPASPTAGLPSGNSVPAATTQMSWTAPASGVVPTNYKIYLYSDADGYTEPIIDGIETATTFYNGLYLAMNTTYLAKVYAEYDPDYKGFSEPLEWYFKTENIILYTVNLSVDPSGGGIVLIQNNGAITGNFEAGTQLNITATPETEYIFWKWTLEGVTVSTQPNFTYTVPASAANLIAHFYQDPDAPTNGTPSGTGVLLVTDTLSWSAPVSGTVPTNYIVYLYSDADMYATPIINGAVVTSTEYTGLDLSGSTTYKVQVYSNYDPDAKGMSAALTWFFTTEEAPEPPATPLNLTVTDIGSQMKLDWSAADFATSYKIYSSTDPYADFAIWVLEAEVTELTWTDTASTVSKKFYKVTGVN